jgi:hypothetical protein
VFRGVVVARRSPAWYGISQVLLVRFKVYITLVVYHCCPYSSVIICGQLVLLRSKVGSPAFLQKLNDILTPGDDRLGLLER